MFYLTIVNKLLRHCHSWLARHYVVYKLEQFTNISFICARQIKIARPLGLQYYHYVSLARTFGMYYNLAQSLGPHYNHYLSPSVRGQLVKCTPGVVHITVC